MNRWLPTLIKHRPDLYRAVYDWNMYPHRWALPAWLEEAGIPTVVVTLLEQSAAGRVRLSAFFRQRLGLSDTFWDFEDPRRRLALLSAESLARLARFAGAVLQADRLAHVITKQQRRDVTARIGEDAYAFALRRARLPSPKNGDSPPRVPDAELAAAVETTGWRALAACMADDPEPLRARFRLKTSGIDDLFRGGASSPAESWTLIQSIVREALKPEEVRCFA